MVHLFEGDDPVLCLLQVLEADLEMHVVRVHTECHDSVAVAVEVDVLRTNKTPGHSCLLVLTAHGRSLL